MTTLHRYALGIVNGLLLAAWFAFLLALAVLIVRLRMDWFAWVLWGVAVCGFCWMVKGVRA